MVFMFPSAATSLQLLIDLDLSFNYLFNTTSTRSVFFSALDPSGKLHKSFFFFFC